MDKIKILQEKIKNRKDSFWYDGEIATIGQYVLIATGEIRIAFPEDDFETWYKNHNAVEEAEKKGYKDRHLKKLEWGNNNWFEVVKGHTNENDHFILEDCRDLDVEFDYDMAIKMLKQYVKIKEYGEIR